MRFGEGYNLYLTPNISKISEYFVINLHLSVKEFARK